MKAGKLYTFDVFVNAAGGRAFISEGGIKASVFGQGLLGTTPWDGTITIDEEYDPIHIKDIGHKSAKYYSIPSIRIIEPLGSDFNDGFNALIVRKQAVRFTGAYDHVHESEIIRTFTLNTMEANLGNFDDRYVTINSNSEYVLKPTYDFVGVKQTIDRGCLYMADIDTSQFATITKVEEINNG